MANKTEIQQQKKLSKWLNQGLDQLKDQKKAIAYTDILFKIRQIQTEPIWNEKMLKQVIISGLQGQTVNLISVLCCINVYDYRGGFGLSSNLCAFEENSRLPNIPSVLDQLINFRQTLQSYNINTDLYIFISDTEYTQVEKFGPITPQVTDTLEKYTQNVRNYTIAKDNQTYVDPISDLVQQDKLYQQVKTRVLRQVTSWKDSDFTRQWYPKFETYYESMNERISKRKIFTPEQARQKTLEMTRRRWAVNAAEGAVFASLGNDTIIVSTETRQKEQTYVIDKDTKNFPPVIYILDN